MIIFLLMFGVLAGLSSNPEKSAAYNYAMAIIAVGCFACCTALTIWD